MSNRKISVIMPVYNEEILLPICLKNIEEFVDEIVIVDGGPFGPSTDETATIAKSCNKVQYIKGTYKTLTGAWDTATQKNTGIAESTGEVLMFMSADMFYINPEHLVDVIQNTESLIYFVPIIEFWLDMNHVRLYGSTNGLSLPGTMQQAVAIDKQLQPIISENGTIEIAEPSVESCLLVDSVRRCHVGWVRPFAQQVEKHIRHVVQGHWGETGAGLLNGSQRKLEQWAILHVLSYKQVPNISIEMDLGEELECLKDMSYMIGQDKVLNDYKASYGVSAFRATE